MDLRKRISERRDLILAAAAKYGARNDRVFGSVARGECNDSSDIDFLIDLDSANQEIWMAETKENAEKAFDYFTEAYGAKYPKAVECLEKDREDLLTFYDFPA